MLRALAVLACLLGACLGRQVIRDRNGYPAVEVRYERFVREVYRNQFTGLSQDMAIWEASVAGSGFYQLGHKVQLDWNNMFGNIPVIRDLSGDQSGQYLRQPVDFQEIWRDQGGTGVRDVAYWRALCPSGFHPVGDIAYACTGCGWPKPSQYFSQYRCVRQDLLEPCYMSSTPTWSNTGDFGSDLVSMWNTVPYQGVSEFWYGARSRSSPPQINSYCLKRPTQDGGGPGFTTRWPGFTTPRPGWTTRWPGFTTRWPGFTTRYPGFTTPRPGWTTRWPGFTTRYPGWTTRWPGFSTRWPNAEGEEIAAEETEDIINE